MVREVEMGERGTETQAQESLSTMSAAEPKCALD